MSFKHKCLTTGLILFFTSLASASSQLFTLSDIHFNPFAACIANTPCPSVQQLTKTDATGWQAVFMQRQATAAPRYKQDTSFNLFSSLLAQLKTQNPKVILILGDNLAHHFYQQYIAFSGNTDGTHYADFVDKTYQFVSQQLKQAAPNASIYESIGNNDSYASPLCSDPDYCSIPNGRFFTDVANHWAMQMQNPSNRSSYLSTTKIAGYYSVTLPNTNGNQLVVLNSNLFSAKARGKNINSAAEQQLRWLQQQLDKNQKAHKKVWLAMHILPGIDVFKTLLDPNKVAVTLWKTDFQKRFIRLLETYPDVVAGIFTGHLHMDGVRMIPIKNHDPIIDSYTPGITAKFGNNPGYKVYRYQPETLQREDFTTYYLPLDKQGPNWQQEYNFKQTYHPNCQICRLIDGYNNLSKSARNSNSQRYIQFFSVNSTANTIKDIYDPYYWCGIHHLDALSYQRCILLK